MKREKFIGDCKRIIKQFEGFTPEEGNLVHQSIQTLIEGYTTSLDKLEDAQKRIIDICSGNFIKKQKRIKESYPKEIKNHHLRVAGIIGSAALLTIAGYLGISLGGTNLAVWPDSLLLISLGIGVPVGFAVATPIYAVNRKKFDRDNVKNRTHKLKLLKFLDIEQKILQKVETKEQSLADLILATNGKLDEMLSGTYSLYQPKQVLKTTKNEERVETVKELKEEYKVLSKKVIKEIEDVLLEYNQEYKNLISTGKTLESKVNTIKVQKTNESRSNTPSFEPDVILDKEGNVIMGEDYFYEDKSSSKTDDEKNIVPSGETKRK